MYHFSFYKSIGQVGGTKMIEQITMWMVRISGVALVTFVVIWILFFMNELGMRI